MGIARSTYYHEPKGLADDTALVEAMHAIKDEFEAYGWRRMQAALRHRGWIVNHKKIKRLMCEHAMHPPLRRRFVATTDSNHDEPVFPDRSREREVDGPNQLWVADLTYIAILGGFVYLAAIMDAWSRRITGYALDRRIDARLTLAALATAIEHRNPPAGCIHHSDRGSQYAAQAYRALLSEHRLIGSMGRRGNPYDNAMMESFMKTLKVEGVYAPPGPQPAPWSVDAPSRRSANFRGVTVDSICTVTTRDSHRHRVPSLCAEYHRPGKAAGGARFPGSPYDMTETAERHDPGGAIQSLRGRQQRHGLAAGRVVARPSRGCSKARRRDHSAGPRPRWRMDDCVRWEGAAPHAAVTRVHHRGSHWAWPPRWSG